MSKRLDALLDEMEKNKTVDNDEEETRGDGFKLNPELLECTVPVTKAQKKEFDALHIEAKKLSVMIRRLQARRDNLWADIDEANEDVATEKGYYNMKDGTIEYYRSED